MQGDTPKSKFEQMLSGRGNVPRAEAKAPAPVKSRPPTAPPAIATVSRPVNTPPKPVAIEPMKVAEPTDGQPRRSSGRPVHRTAEELRSAVNDLRIDRDARQGSSGGGGLSLWLVLVLSGLSLAGGYVLSDQLRPAPSIPQDARAPAGASGNPGSARPLAAPGVPAAPAPMVGELVYEGAGKIVSDQRVSVATKVSGQIVAMYVEQGDTVNEGDPIADIEDINFRALHDQAAAQLEAARADVLRASAQLARGQAGVEAAKAQQAQAQSSVDQSSAATMGLSAQLAFSQWNLSRLERLGVATAEVELQSARTSVATAQSALDGNAMAIAAANAAVDSARAAVAVAEADLLTLSKAVMQADAQVEAASAAYRLARKRLDDCRVVAPIAGVILERNSNVGDFVAAEGGLGGTSNSQFVVIADMQRLRVEVDINERDVNKVRAGMPCVIVPTADKSRVYDGQVMWVDPVVNRSTALVQVKVRVLNPDRSLRIDGNAEVRFNVRREGAAQHASASNTQPASASSMQPAPASSATQPAPATDTPATDTSTQPPS